MIDGNLISRIESALSSNNLMSLFEELETEGLEQKELEKVFTDFLQSIDSQETDEEKIIELLEIITGYCQPSFSLFPPDKYKVYPGIIRFFAAFEDQKLIIRFIFENTSFRLFHRSSYENSNLEIKTFDELDFSKPLRFYLWNRIISDEYSIHEQWFEHIQKRCWSFISDPTIFLSFGENKNQILEPSLINYGFRHYPTQAFFESIEPIRSYIDKLQVATAIGVPILQDAYLLIEKDFSFRESAETRWSYNLDLK
ncbi:MAG: hypothetical protein ABI891_02930 [Acidobacteriota bacterium]